MINIGSNNTFGIGDLVEHIEFRYIGKITSIAESDILNMDNGTIAGNGTVAYFVDNLSKVYSVTGAK